MQDQKAFIELVDAHRGILLKVVRMYMNTAEDQDDLYQEIVFQLWKSFASFKAESQFSTWMYRVALNTAITYLKNDKRRVDADHGYGINYGKEENYDNAHEDRLTQFYDAVKELTKVEKAIILSLIEGHSQTQIAENLGLSEVNARVKLARTKKKLKRIIKEKGYEF